MSRTNAAFRISIILLATVAVAMIASAAHAQPSIDLLTVTDSGPESETWSVSLQVLVFMTMLSLLPALLMTMTSFTRIVIILAILRQGLGVQQTPSNSILIGIALIMTAFVMAPVIGRVNSDAVQPYLEETMPAAEAVQTATTPFREFMLKQTRESDLATFVGLSGSNDFASIDDVPFTLLLPAFLTSELKTAFQIGFLLLIPFLIIDLVVASVLMSVGMVMLSPLIISLPFKILLFVLVDGWELVMTTIAGSFTAR